MLEQLDSAQLEGRAVATAVCDVSGRHSAAAKARRDIGAASGALARHARGAESAGGKAAAGVPEEQGPWGARRCIACFGPLQSAICSAKVYPRMMPMVKGGEPDFGLDCCHADLPETCERNMKLLCMFTLKRAAVMECRVFCLRARLTVSCKLHSLKQLERLEAQA